MRNVKIGDAVSFLYHGKMRNGTIESLWGERLARVGTPYRAAGFCLDHGSEYKSYRNNKTRYLAKVG